MAKTLYAASYPEFGHLVLWQALVRGLARQYDRVIVSSRHDCGPFFDDFAHEFRGIRLACDSDMDHPYEASARDLELIASVVPKGDDVTILEVRDSHYHKNQQEGFVFRKFGLPDPKYAGFLIFHARLRGIGADHNWNSGNWMILIDALRARGIQNPIVFIGRPDLSEWHPGGFDFRGIHLRETMNLMRSADLIVGPSSGPIHLASHCGCKQVVWNGDGPGTWREAQLRERYKTDWNPFGTPCKMLDRWTWQPTVEEVALAIEEVLRA